MRWGSWSGCALKTTRIQVEDLNDPSIDKSSWSWVPVEEKIEHFKFVTLPPEDAADLLIKNAVEWGSNSTFLSIEAADGTSWACDPGEPLLTQGCQEWRVISKNAVFLSRADVEAIKAAHATPAPGTIKNAPQRRSVPRDNSLICTLAALLAAWPGGAIPSGKDLEKAAQSIGLTLSDDTIRKALKAAQETAPSLPLPK